ncbi:penicillin-binding transpeptidase domain-containing protein, partial [Pseudomonadota bacterium]
HASKKDIFESYLNLVSYGRNIEGVGAASLIYFNKQAHELSLIEALTLSVIPQNPSKRNPTTRLGTARIIEARKRLYTLWKKEHGNNEFLHTLVNLPLSMRDPRQLPFLAPHLVNSINSNLPSLTYGNIYTTLNWNSQKITEEIIRNYVARKKDQGIHNATALILNHVTMEMEAEVGSADFNDASIDGQVNGVQAKRSPGSALKPFVYALAMDQGLIHPMSLLRDAPLRYGGFTPENYDKKFLGPVFARDALITSRNVPAVRLQSKLRKLSFYEFLRKANVSKLQEESHYGLSLALGGVEITMEELVSLYAMLANGGKLIPIKKHKSQSPDSKNIFFLLSREASYLTLDILKDNPAPADEQELGDYRILGEVAWKTGTSYAYRDAWAVGVSGNYVIAVWVGR